MSLVNTSDKIKLKIGNSDACNSKCEKVSFLNYAKKLVKKFML